MKKADDISQSMCIMPWIGLATDPSGGIRPCCWMEAITPEKFLGDPKEYRDSEYLKNFKQRFKDGEYPDACWRCKHDDSKRLESKRVRENKSWEDAGGDWDKVEDSRFDMVDLRLSNVCNLGCVMCGPKSSSFIKKEVEEHRDIAPKHNARQIRAIEDRKLDLLNPYTDKQIDEIIDEIGPNARIYCTGGEPSLVKKTTTLLEVLLEKGYNKTVTLQFNSNFQTLNQRWFDLLKNFKGDMLPSLDGVGKTAEYVRYPCDWKKVSTNLKTFIEQCGETWTVKIMPTVSIVSIFGLPELYRWWYGEVMNEIPLVKQRVLRDKHIAMRVQVNNRLVNPEFFDVRNLPPKAKQDAKREIENIIKTYGPLFQLPKEEKFLRDAIGQIDLEPNEDFSVTIEQLNKFDKMRNMSWRESLPQLGRYTNG